MTTKYIGNFKLEDNSNESRGYFVLLGSFIHKDGRSDNEINRIIMGNDSMKNWIK